MYKREIEKLKELSFNVLNQIQNTKKMKFDDNSDQSIGDGGENKPYAISKAFPNMDFGNASNITINFNK